MEVTIQWYNGIAERPILIDGFKEYAKIDFNDDDLTIKNLLELACTYFETQCGIGIGLRDVSVIAEKEGIAWLPIYPKIDETGHQRFAVVEGEQTYKGGFADVPPHIISAIYRMTLNWYEYRDDVQNTNVKELPITKDIISTFRRRIGL